MNLLLTSKSAAIFRILLALVAFAFESNSAHAQSQRPNIVVFLADDLGQLDLGCYGSTFYETPHIDQLAREGVRFTNGYAACPVCSPTRASLLTGLYPTRTGITDYIGAPQPAQWKRNTILQPAPYATRLALEETTIAEALKGVGYSTFFAGKWHLGDEGAWPEDQGFDVNMGGTDRGGPYGGDKYFSPYGNPRLADGPQGEHLPDRLATEAAKFIAANREKPFLIYLPFYDVHTPLMARADLQKKYEAKRKQLGLEERWGREFERDVRLVQSHAIYAAMVEAMDQAVGKVLAALRESAVDDNTLVIFTSDNGGLSTSEGWPTSNMPLRGGKGWMYEGGIREPWIVRWPGVTRSGTSNDTPITSPDLFPTLLAAAGAAGAAALKSDGVNIEPLLRGESLEERALFWHYPHYGNQGGAPAAAIRRGDWKLIKWFETGRRELFHLGEDPGELNDLADKEVGRVGSLLAELQVWLQATGAKLPTDNTNYDSSQPNGRSAKRAP